MNKQSMDYRKFLPEKLEISEKSRIAIQAALAGGKAILTKVGSLEVKTKEGIGNFVTNADKASEQAIISVIETQFPEDQILSEETESRITDILNIENLWVIDPLDGSNNFVYGRHRSAVSVAFVKKGEALSAAVFDLFHNELYFAEKSRGAFLNGKKLEVGLERELSKAVVTTDAAYEPQIMRYHLRLLLNLPITPPRILMRGSSVLSICEVAAGKSDLFFHSYLEPWDIAASLLVIEEADGGTATKMDGSKTNFMSNDIVAGNSILIKQFVNFSKDVEKENIK